MEAIARIHEDRLIQLSEEATPIALMATALIKTQGCKTAKPEWFNPYTTALRKRQVRKILRLEAAIAYEQLRSEGRMPEWVFAHRDVFDDVQLLIKKD